MASRLIFLALEKEIGVTIKEIKFDYYSGFAISQKQKSILSLHCNAEREGFKNILEVSTKSLDELGVLLSAFNLSAETQKKNKFTVECAFQSSKVFEHGGPYIDIFNKTSKEAKLDKRLRESGDIIKFKFFNYTFDKNPPTYFYDWLYINTLLKNDNLVKMIREYNVFSDIEFNQKKSINCQAYSLSLFKSFLNNNIPINKLKDPIFFLEISKDEYDKRWNKNLGTDKSNLQLL
jgi:hypothetical protein